MESKVNYTLVGLFVLVLGSALIGALVWLTAGRTAKVYDTYAAYMTESVSGLNLKAKVKYRGVDVGEVREIALDHDNPERVRLLLDIQRGTPVKVDTVAILATQGITGLAYVELTGGSRDAPDLRAGTEQQYPVIKTGPSLLVRLDKAVSSLVGSMTTAAGDLSAVAERVNTLLSNDNQQAFAATLRNAEKVTGVLSTRADALEQDLKNVSAILANAAQVSQKLPEMVSGVNGGVAAVRQAMGNISRAAGGVDRMVADTQQALVRSSGDSLARVNALLVELQDLSRTLERLGREMERDPNMLLFGRQRLPPGPGE